jgi:hypothetical protein
VYAGGGHPIHQHSSELQEGSAANTGTTLKFMPANVIDLSQSSAKEQDREFLNPTWCSSMTSCYPHWKCVKQVLSTLKHMLIMLDWYSSALGAIVHL